MLLELRNDVEKSDAIARDLAGAETQNVVQRVFRCRPLFGELDQRSVLRHNVGRQLRGSSELLAQRTQRIEQRLIFARDLRSSGRRAFGRSLKPAASRARGSALRREATAAPAR